MSKIYLTTAIPYVNGAPHIGHAMDYCLADTYARYQKLLKHTVRFQVGTDEHGNKIFQKAKELGIDIDTYVSNNSTKFKDFIARLGVEYTDFVRTTDPKHQKTCQTVWQKLSPHIYRSSYTGWYCSGCERFVTEKEYAENHGSCPDHQKPYEKLEEENYYLRISDFKARIKTAIESSEMLILPDFRKKEILKLLEDAPDVSISRPASALSWGIPVPGDDSQVMYVWIDALTNYLTAVGYPEGNYADWWPPAAMFVGKDILRFHAIIWPAMLLGLGLPLPKVIISHGFVLADGQKMSKSIGNVVDPVAVLEKHGVDAFRYFFLRHMDTFADSDFTWEKFEKAYASELANDLGNLVQRLATLASKNSLMLSARLTNKYSVHASSTPPPSDSSLKPDSATAPPDSSFNTVALSQDYIDLMSKFEFSRAFDFVWSKVQALNKRIDDEKPWTLKDETLKNSLTSLIEDLLALSQMLYPFLPSTTINIAKIFSPATKITPPIAPLFPKN